MAEAVRDVQTPKPTPTIETVVFVDGQCVNQISGEAGSEWRWQEAEHKTGIRALVRTKDDQLPIVVDPWQRIIAISTRQSTLKGYLFGYPLPTEQSIKDLNPIVFGRSWQVGDTTTNAVGEVVVPGMVLPLRGDEERVSIGDEDIRVTGTENPFSSARRLLSRDGIVEYIRHLGIPMLPSGQAEPVRIDDDNLWLMAHMA